LQIHVIWKYENRSEDVKSKGTYHLCEEQSPYSDDFAHDNYPIFHLNIFVQEITCMD